MEGQNLEASRPEQDGIRHIDEHGHLCAAEAGQAAAISKPGNLLLTHFFSDAPEFIESQRQAALAEFKTVLVARPGLVVPVER